MNSGLIHMLLRYFSFRARHQPYMVRHSYTHELRSAATFPLAASLAEGAFTGVVAAKNFDAPIVLMSVITAAPMFGNIMALFWSELSVGRRKVPLVNLLQFGVVLMIASVALTAYLPPSVGGWVFASQIIVARVLASGIVTIRSSIWRSNYPREIRGQITSRIAVVATTALALTTFVGSYMLDRNPRSYVYLYPAAALLGLIGIYQFSQVRVRRESALLRNEQQVYAPRPENVAQTDEGNVLNYNPEAARWGWHRAFGQAWEILRADKAFRDYQRWQFVSGMAFMMSTPALIFMVSKEMTEQGSDYLLATIVVQIIPMVTALLCTPLWAPIFDRLHITQFRVWQGWVSLVALTTLYAGALWGLKFGDGSGVALTIVAIAQALIGVTNAGGALAWNLGHNDFAPPGKSSVYMGVHVMLTGLRGSIGPFVGSWLFAMPMVGRHIFSISVLLMTIALIGFWHMTRQMPRHPRPERAAGSPLTPPGRRHGSRLPKPTPPVERRQPGPHRQHPTTHVDER